MSNHGSLTLTLKVIAVALLVVSASMVVASAVLSNYFEQFTLNPSSSANASTGNYDPAENYTLTVTASNCAVNIIPSHDNLLSATLNVTSSFFLKASASIDVTSTNSSYEFQLITPQYWGVFWGLKATANVYVPDHIAARSLTVDTQNGAINAEVPNAVHGVSLETTNGQVSLRGQELRNIDTQTTNGNTYISVLSFSTITSSAVNGQVQAIISNATSGGSISLSTTNGGITYLANPNSNLSISASTVNGLVSISGMTYDAAVSSIRQFVGTVNGGGTSVVLSTVNGGVSIGSSLPVS